MLAPSLPATAGQMERRADETGASVSPLAAATTAIAGSGASSSPRSATRPNSSGYAIIRRREHGARPAPVDLPAAVRRPDRDRDPVRGRDEPGLGVVAARTAHEQHERERRHPERQPGDDAPDEERSGVIVREERAVARDAAHLASRGGQAQDVTSTAGGEPPTSGAPRRLCCSQSTTTT